MKPPALATVFVAGFVLPTLLFAQAGYPEPKKPPLEMPDYNWQQDAKDNKLTDQEIAALKKQGFVVTGKNYKQIFQPYVSGAQVFITSDTVINAYSVLLEDSLLRLERINAVRLKNFLEAAWKQLDGIEKDIPGDKNLTGAAAERARMVIGVALQLSTGEKVNGAPGLVAKIDAEAQRVIAATGQSKPEWLGKPDEGFEAIDYTRFEPRGFYAGNPMLERYFRSVSWLQAIPFRPAEDVEFASFLILYRFAHDSNDKGSKDALTEMEATKEAYSTLLGDGDNGDLFGRSYETFGKFSLDAAFLEEKRKNLAMEEPKGGPQINDQIARSSKDGKPELSFRVLSAQRVPDALLFAKTETLRKGVYPGGLDVAAVMGSPLARKFFESHNPALLKALDAEKKSFGEESLYGGFLKSLSLLLQPGDKAAPALFHSAEWEAKSLQTFLGGWAQERHAWILQTKQNVEYLGMTISVPSGFVEPVPDFFGSMSRLAGTTAQTFGNAGAYAGGANNDAIDQLRALAEALKRHPGNIQMQKLPEEEQMIFESGFELVMAISDDETGEAFMHDEDASALIPVVEELEHHLETGKLSMKEQMRLSYMNPNPEFNWQGLALLCSKLEALSQKQLRGLPFSKVDNEFVTHYGETLAGIMFYAGNSYDNPRDDAPRICDIFTDPNEGKVLLAGIGRPSQIYVLYPYGGKQILTHGAVFPYYEFPGGQRLTDKEWRVQLDSKQPPLQPAWLGDVQPH